MSQERHRYDRNEVSELRCQASPGSGNRICKLFILRHESMMDVNIFQGADEETLNSLRGQIMFASISRIMIFWWAKREHLLIECRIL